MAGTVGDIGNQLEGRTFGVAQQTVHGLYHHPDQIYVLPLVEAADVVGFGHGALVENQVYGTCVVLHIEPVAHVLALAVDGKGTAVADIVDEQGYQFLGELVGAVVVGAVGDNGGHAVGVVIGTHEVVAACLGGRIWRMGVVLGGFVEEIRAVRQVVFRRRSSGGERRFNAFGMSEFQCAIHLVGGDVVEALSFVPLGQ